jgi:hypothetical protein
MSRSSPAGDPTRLGPFQLTGRVDETPAGIVYQGVDPHGRQVTLAVLNQGAADDAAARDRFRAAILAEPLDRRPPDGTGAIVGAEPEGPTPWVATLREPGSSGAERFLGAVLLKGRFGRRAGRIRGPLFQPHWLGSRQPALSPAGLGPMRESDRGIAMIIMTVAALLVLAAVLMLLLFACGPTAQPQPTPTPVFPTPTQTTQSPTPTPTRSSPSPTPSRSGSPRPTPSDGGTGAGNGGDA